MKTNKTPAKGAEATKKLSQQISEASRQTESAKHLARNAKAELKLARRRFKQAKKSAKLARKELKALRQELEVARQPSRPPATSKAKRADAVRKPAGPAPRRARKKARPVSSASQPPNVIHVTAAPLPPFSPPTAGPLVRKPPVSSAESLPPNESAPA